MHKRLATLLARFAISNRGVIHIGAHIGQESPVYDSCGLTNQLWIEPQPQIFARLIDALPKRADVLAVNIACGEKPGEATMYKLANNDGMSNSLLEPKDHQRVYPDKTPDGTTIVRVARLDDILIEQRRSAAAYSLLVLDVQGFELHALRGAVGTLAHMQAIITEVSTTEMYAGGATLGELDTFLGTHGFTRVVTRVKKHRQHGDALYVATERLSGWQKFRLRFFGPSWR